MRQRHLFIPFTKVNAETREVSGRLTQEVVDRDGEIWDFESSAPHVKEWSDGFAKATDGKSYGNLRAMHRNISAGKLTALDINEDEKAVDIVAKVVDDAEWEKVDEGVYTGFSLGGGVVRSWRAAGEKHKRFEVKPVEASLADFPCVPTAMFKYVKAGGGGEEMRPFKKVADSVATIVEYADTTKSKYPLDSRQHVRAAIARWGKRENRAGYSESAQKTISRRILAAARKFGIGEKVASGTIDLTEKTMLAGDFTKGMYEVSSLANLIEALSWAQRNARFERENEGDDSGVPDQLAEHIDGLLDTLAVMFGEESAELLASIGVTDDVTTTEDIVMADSTKVAAGAAVATNPSDVVFTKAMAKKHIEALGGLHDKFKAAHTMLGEACEKLAGMRDEAGKGGATAAAEDEDESTKTAKVQFEKVTGERDDFQKRYEKAEADRLELVAKVATVEGERDAALKQAEELAEAGELLLESRKGALRSVSKEGDSREGGPVSTKTATATGNTSTATAPTVPDKYDPDAARGSFLKAVRGAGFSKRFPGEFAGRDAEETPVAT